MKALLDKIYLTDRARELPIIFHKEGRLDWPNNVPRQTTECYIDKPSQLQEQTTTHTTPGKFFRDGQLRHGKCKKLSGKTFHDGYHQGRPGRENLTWKVHLLMENRHRPFPDGYCRHERVFASVFPFPPGNIFPVGYTTIREGSNFSCRVQYRQGRIELSLSVNHRQGNLIFNNDKSSWLFATHSRSF